MIEIVNSIAWLFCGVFCCWIIMNEMRKQEQARHKQWLLRKAREEDGCEVRAGSSFYLTDRNRAFLKEQDDDD